MAISLKNKNVLISGASIAGPALAFWLQRYGFTVTVMEQAPGLRVGGHKIDIRGKTTDIVKKMGLYEKIQHSSADIKTASFVSEEGKKTVEMPADFLGMREPNDVELLRADLSRILYESTCNSCEYIFNDAIKSVKQDDQEVKIDFVKSPSRKFDLLVGADGFHSSVRSLVFGKESHFSHNLGDYYVAIYSMENYLNLDRSEIFYSSMNKLASIGNTKGCQNAQAQFIFRSSELNYDYRDIQQQKDILSKMYANDGWEIPILLGAMDKAPDFYFDTVRQIRMDTWSKDRTILIGDAAYCPCLASGQGASMALVGAYVLAGELFVALGDHKIAFVEYEKEMKAFVKTNQQLGEMVMRQMVPKSERWIQSAMNKLISSLPFLQTFFIKKLRKQFLYAANCIHLKDYEVIAAKIDY